jgi:hypothetical protein
VCSGSRPDMQGGEQWQDVIVLQRRCRGDSGDQRWGCAARRRGKDTRRLMLLRGRLLWISRRRSAMLLHDEGWGRVPRAHRHCQCDAMTHGWHESGRHGRADENSGQDQQRQQHPARAQLVEAVVHALSLTKRAGLQNSHVVPEPVWRLDRLLN